MITLALGIGATTAIFTLIQQVMLRSLPVARPDQLWRIGEADLCCYSDGYTQLYDVIAYGVEPRTSEIGVRMSLGANRRSVVWMVLRAAFWQLGIGLAFGIPAAIGAGYLIASRLFGVRPWDPLMLSPAAALLVVAAAMAAAVPARRAANLNPVEALRAE